MKQNTGIKFLSTQEISSIYEKCLDILSRKGVKVDHQQALRILDKAGAQVDFNNQQVRFPKDIIETALQSVPHGFALEGNNIVPHPDGMFYVETSTGERTYVDPNSNTPHDVTLADVAHMSQLFEAIDGLTSAGFSFPSDVPLEIADIHGLKVLLENTSKHITVQPYSLESIEYLLELASVAGSTEALRKKRVINIICCATSPLTFKALDAEVIIQACRCEQAIEAASLSSAGTTAPITIAGQVLLAAVEILAILVMSQLTKPGTPFIASPLCLAVDMSTGKSLLASVESCLSKAAGVQFIKDAFRVPTKTFGSVTDCHVLDWQFAIEATLNAQLVATAGCDILTGAGSMGTGISISPVKMIVDNTLASILKRVVSGITVNDDTLAWKEIIDIEHGGHFLDRPHTLQHCREVLWPEIFSTLDLEGWKAAGSKSLYDRAFDKYRELKKSLQPLQLPKDVKNELNRIVKQAGERLVK